MNIKNAVEKSKGERPNYPAELTITARDTLKSYKKVLGTENYSETVMRLIEFHDSQNENVLPTWKEFFAQNYKYFTNSDEECTAEDEDDYEFEGFYRPPGKNLIGERKINAFKDDAIVVESSNKYTVVLIVFGARMFLEPKYATQFVSAWLKSSE